MQAEHASARILVVDDHESSTRLLEKIFMNAGYQNIRPLTTQDA